MEIFLVRHGEADPQKKNTPLTNKGLHQAKNVSNELSRYKFDKVYSSNLLRAKQTCEKFTNNYKEDFRLKEVYRVLIGGPKKENAREEREEEDKKNADSIFNEIINLKHDKVLIFAHGNLIRYFIKKIKGIKAENLWANMKINNGSITIIENINNNLIVKEINRNDYLIKEDSMEYIEE